MKCFRLPHRFFIPLVLACAGVFYITSCNPAPKGQSASLKDYEDALTQAKATGGLALLDFYADY